jgi:dolichol-phosphate mannosyltransferase
MMQARRSAPALCVLVPTRNEAGNVTPLVDRLTAALAGIDAEALFVDDSSDATPDVVRAIAEGSALPVRLLHRPPAERTGGLGGAVLAGIRATTARWVIVMDGDLQHPPEIIPSMLGTARACDLDVVVASRNCADGSRVGLASWYRGVVSSGATTSAKALFPRRLAAVTDPMSGFFGLRRTAVDPETLRPRGFKIRGEHPRFDAVRAAA